MIEIHGLPVLAKAIQSSIAATSAPAIGVQRPAEMSTPNMAPANRGATYAEGGLSLNASIPWQSNAIPMTNR
jgi:hypothetical protein